MLPMSVRDNLSFAALERLSQTYGESTLPKQVAAFGISGGDGGGLKRLLMSHPPLDERIAALRSLQVDGSAMRQGVVSSTTMIVSAEGMATSTASYRRRRPPRGSSSCRGWAARWRAR